MSALADYFVSAHRRERALWRKNLCATTSPNPLAVGKWCDGNCALPINEWSTVPAHDGGLHGSSLKTKSFPEPARKHSQIISSKRQPEAALRDLQVLGCRRPGRLWGNLATRATMIFRKILYRQISVGISNRRSPARDRHKISEFCFISGNVSS